MERAISIISPERHIQRTYLVRTLHVWSNVTDAMIHVSTVAKCSRTVPILPCIDAAIQVKTSERSFFTLYVPYRCSRWKTLQVWPLRLCLRAIIEIDTSHENPWSRWKRSVSLPLLFDAVLCGQYAGEAHASLRTKSADLSCLQTATPNEYGQFVEQSRVDGCIEDGLLRWRSRRFDCRWLFIVRRNHRRADGWEHRGCRWRRRWRWPDRRNWTRIKRANLSFFFSLSLSVSCVNSDTIVSLSKSACCVLYAL